MSSAAVYWSTPLPERLCCLACPCRYVDRFATLDIDAASLRNLSDAELRDELEVRHTPGGVGGVLPGLGLTSFVGRSPAQSTAAVSWRRSAGSELATMLPAHWRIEVTVHRRVRSHVPSPMQVGRFASQPVQSVATEPWHPEECADAFHGSIPTEPPGEADELDTEGRRLSRVSWGDEEIHEFVSP